LFKRAKLRKETLRRIVNHALSQSVPASAITTINGFTKLFVGEIIEKARTVQAEWAEAYDQAALAAFKAEEAALEAKALAESTPQKRPDTISIAENGIKGESSNGAGTPDTASVHPHFSSTSSLTSNYRQGSQTALPPLQSPLQAPSVINDPNDIPQGSVHRSSREFKPPPNPHCGQLLPSHLREALRRYKRNGEGGGVGASTLSQQHFSVKGSFTWSIGPGGQRLFR
jgi:transcription initiation factor TFIID subunit 11